MAKKKALTTAETLEQYRVALENVVNQSLIANTMLDFGYDATKITQGKTLWQEANNAYTQNLVGGYEKLEAYTKFKNSREKLDEIYSLHRKKAKVVFREQILILEKLGVTITYPRAYIKWLEIIKIFYSTVSSDIDIKTKLMQLNISENELNETMSLITEIEALRAEYLKEKGESQSATINRDQAVADIDYWMRDFYAVAQIAFEDNPQMLEALSLKV